MSVFDLSGSMSKETTFCRIRVLSKGDCYLLTTLRDGGENGFDLDLFDGDLAWQGKLMVDHLEKLCAKIDLDYNSFVDQTALALTGRLSGVFSFQYEMELWHDELYFVWKKISASEDIKLQLGWVKLEKAANTKEVLLAIFNHCMQSQSQLSSKIIFLETENDRLSTERSYALKRLEKCVLDKENMEKDLFSKFVFVLNKKKEKIKELLQKSADHNMQMSSQRDMSCTQEGESSNEPESEDNIKPSSSASASLMKSHVETGASSKSIDKEDSLVLDDADIIHTKVSRPKRQKCTRKQTPSKVTIPRASSKKCTEERTPDRPCRYSLRKSLAGSSSENIDTDELFKDL